jgi:hypothetical protein
MSEEFAPASWYPKHVHPESMFGGTDVPPGKWGPWLYRAKSRRAGPLDGPSREDWVASLDPSSARYVDVLYAAGIRAYESCEGGEGHSYVEPKVRFYGERAVSTISASTPRRARSTRATTTPASTMPARSEASLRSSCSARRQTPDASRQTPDVKRGADEPPSCEHGPWRFAGAERMGACTSPRAPDRVRPAACRPDDHGETRLSARL